MHLPEIASRETFKEKSKRHIMVIEVVKKSPYVRKGSKRAPAKLKRRSSSFFDRATDN